MSNQEWWVFRHRQVYPFSSVPYATEGLMVDLENDAATARARQQELSQAESYRGTAGPKYVNYWGNDCGSFYGGNSSTCQEITDEQRPDSEGRNMIRQMDHTPVVDGSINTSLLRCDLHANTSMSNQNYWQSCNHRHLYPTSTVQYGNGSSRVEYVQDSHCRHGGHTVDLENHGDAESYRGAAGQWLGWGNESCCRASCCHRDCGSSCGREGILQMDSIPHVPKINSRIPSADEATSDHQRLLDRLEVYDLYEHQVSGDGNCQFRSLSDQLYQTSEYHKEVRQQIVDQLKANPDLYAPYVPMPYHEYLMKISTLGEWGDHVTLQAAADWYGVRIFVLTSYKDTCYIEILPRQQKSERVIYLSFWAEVHYNSIYPIGVASKSDNRMRDTGITKWWKWNPQK